jgi:hypothetical protein
MSVKIELPLAAIEPLFTALYSIDPMKTDRLQMKAVGLLKSALYFELEKMMETVDEKAERTIDFKKIFTEERHKRLMTKDEEQRTY